MPAFAAIPISPRVYWVGAIDWNLREFHGYHTGRGSTYNAYLVMGERIALIDTVKAPFAEEMLARIASVIDPRRIDVLISLHSEMDHSGALPRIIQAIQPDEIHASPGGVSALAAHFHHPQSIVPVADGSTLSLGGLTLRFLHTPMLHWPDSMMALLEEEGILFSQDGFGMHLAASSLFDDQLPADLLEHEAAKYFANILLPFSPLILALGQKVAQAGLRFRMIAPDHGPIWRDRPHWIIEKTLEWARQRPRPKAVIVYDTMWGSDDLMARAIADGLTRQGITVQVMRLDVCHRSGVITEILDAGAVIVGSPTLNGGLFPSVADFLCYLKGLQPRNKVGAVFGSHGWSGQATGLLERELEAIGVTRVAETQVVQYVPTEADLERCREVGLVVGRKLREACKLPAEPPLPQPAGPDLTPLFLLSYGLYVVGSRLGDKLNGQISDAVMQVTDTPARIVVAINKTELTHECIATSRAFAISILDESAPQELIGLFGFRSGRECEKFQGLEHGLTPTGSPYLTAHVAGWADCRVVEQVDVGTHTLFIGRVIDCRILGSGRPMTYTYYREVLRGKSPPNAPGFRAHAGPPPVVPPLVVPAASPPPASAPAAPASAAHACGLCGWIYDPAKGDPEHGIAPGTAFADLPATWRCPLCGVGKDQFKPVASSAPAPGPAPSPATHAAAGKATCPVCGYVYDPAKGIPEQGLPPGTGFAQLPADWSCPVCKLPKTDFVPG